MVFDSGLGWGANSQDGDTYHNQPSSSRQGRRFALTNRSAYHGLGYYICAAHGSSVPPLGQEALVELAAGKRSASTFTVVVLAVALVITASILVHVLFSNNVTDLTVELLAAIIAVVLVVASVGVTIHFQVRSETEREYRVELFRQKLELYKDTIACVTRGRR